MATTMKGEAVSRQTVAEEYREDVDEDFTGLADASEASMEAAVEVDPALETEPDDVEDHAAVTSEEPAAAELDVEAPELGELGGEVAAPDQELEAVDGFDERLLEMDRESAATVVPEDRLLDAWHAEFSDPATMAVMLQQPKLTETMAEVVIGADDRVRIQNTTAYPWRCVCSLKITAKDGSLWIGTGWLVGPRTVITAGHCVYIHSRGGWARSVEVIPGRNGAQRPYDSCVASNFRSVKGWTQKKKRSHDYGAIILPAKHPYGKRLGYFGYASLSYFSLLNLKVNLGGYPGDKPAGTLWWHARRVKWVTARTLVYNIDTAGGQSGSPVWRLRNGKRHVVGIHTNGSTSGNSATRIVKPVFDNIKKWKAEGA